MVCGTYIFKTSEQNAFTVDQRGLKRENRNLPLVGYKLEECGKRMDRYVNATVNILQEAKQKSLNALIYKAFRLLRSRG